MKITDEAVEVVAGHFYTMTSRIAWSQIDPHSSVALNYKRWAREALESLPHLEGATPGSCTCGSYLDRDGDLQKDADAPDCPVHGEGATPAIDPNKAAGAAVAAIVYNLPVDGFGDERRLKDYARIWGNAAAKAVLALIGGAK